MADRTSRFSRFSLDDVPAGDRRAMMFEFFGKTMRRIQVEPLDEEAPLKCNAEVQTLDGASWGLAEMSHVSAHRSGSLMDDGCDDLMLFMPSSGITIRLEGGSEIEVEANGVLLMSQARAAATHYHGPARTFAFRFPREKMRELIPGLTEAPCAVLNRDNPALRLLFDYGYMLHRQPVTDPALQREISTHLQQLAALAITAAPELAEFAEESGVAAARLAAIKQDVRNSLGERDVSVGAIALRHRITPRYIHLLFEREGQTFGAYVNGERLALVRRILADPRNDHLKISDVAFAAGFHDLSTFNRQFRRQYRMTPRDYRMTSQGSKNG